MKTLTIEVDLSSVKVQESKEHQKIVKVTKDLAFEMKYPDLDTLGSGIKADDVEGVFELVARSVDKVYHGEDVIEINEGDVEDLKTILNDLSSKQFAEVQNFFSTAPKLKKEIEFGCKKCGHENKQVLEGLSSFF